MLKTEYDILCHAPRVSALFACSEDGHHHHHHHLACSEDGGDHEAEGLDGGEAGGVEPQLDPHVHLLVSRL